MARSPRLNLVLSLSLLSLAACDEGVTPTQPGTLDAQSVSLLAPSNTWVAKRQLPTARFHARAATLNNIIYVVGGTNRTLVHLRRVDAYDVATNTWSVRHELPSARSYFNGVSVISGMLYVTGGYINGHFGRPVKTLFVYDPGTDTWTAKHDMPQAGACGAQGVIAGKLYVYIACDVGTNKLFRYNPVTDHWITLAPPPNPHVLGEGRVLGGEFYLAGGSEEDKLDAYNPATNTWRTRAPMPAPSGVTASAVLNGKLFVAGGIDPETRIPLATLRVYTPTTNTWTTKASMPTARLTAAGAAAGGLFFVIGGEEAGQVSRKVEAYTP
jgi:N-acetylneuraminic acid mutarotase